MRQIHPAKIAVRSGLFLIFSAVLFSFSLSRGGDVFKIFLNDKMVVEQFVSEKTSVKMLTLDQSNLNDRISIYYSHCGQIGKKRAIVIRDAQDQVLKEWRFTDSKGEHQPMVMAVKDILQLQKNHSKLKVYYSSVELPGGKLLATVVSSGKNTRITRP
ncbi:MAG TPA: hypothetical protein VM012_14265 [Flavitalea sp.]|nr:hypothetical protein [Flavitalea sp.]